MAVRFTALKVLTVFSGNAVRFTDLKILTVFAGANIRVTDLKILTVFLAIPEPDPTATRFLMWD